MTISPNEPLEYNRPTDEDVSEQEANERDEELVPPDTELATGGYDDRQESLEESEPRKQPRQDD